MNENQRLFLLFDQTCPLCRRFSAWVDRLDTRGIIKALPLDDLLIAERFPYLDVRSAQRELTVCDQLGQNYRGMEALRQLADALPAIRRLKWAYRLPGVTPALNQVYQTVHYHRRRLCLKCGEKWMPSKKYSRRTRNRKG